MKVCLSCHQAFEVDRGFCPMCGTPLANGPETTQKGLVVGPDPDEGRILDGRYRLEARIGAGAMGVVHRAVHVAIGKKVAIKLLKPGRARDPDMVRRFLLEAQVASRLKHPNVVDISDFGALPGGGAYYVMEYLEGTSLAEEIDANGPLSPQRALGIARQVALALGAAQHHGVVHRDLKPDNVFLEPGRGSEPELVKILDFGIARVTGRQTRITATGTVVGTPEYMSPEQAQGLAVDGRSDLYALGIILFEMLTGRPPFFGTTVAATVTRQIFDPAPHLAEVLPALADLRGIDALVQKLLAKAPDDRPPSADTVLALIEAALREDESANRGEPTSAPKSSGRGRDTSRLGSWKTADDAEGGSPILGWPRASPLLASSAGAREAEQTNGGFHRWGPSAVFALVGISAVGLAVLASARWQAAEMDPNPDSVSLEVHEPQPTSVPVPSPGGPVPSPGAPALSPGGPTGGEREGSGAEGREAPSRPTSTPAASAAPAAPRVNPSNDVAKPRVRARTGASEPLDRSRLPRPDSTPTLPEGASSPQTPVRGPAQPRPKATVPRSPPVAQERKTDQGAMMDDLKNPFSQGHVQTK